MDDTEIVPPALRFLRAPLDLAHVAFFGEGEVEVEGVAEALERVAGAVEVGAAGCLFLVETEGAVNFLGTRGCLWRG
jgi:hypothetical protein